MTVDPQLLLLSDLNLMEFYREQARFLSPFALEERDGLLFTASGTRSPAAPFNVAMRATYGQSDPQHLIDQARTFYAARNRGFSIHARTHHDRDLIEACEQAEFPRMSGRSPGMALTERVVPKSLASGVESRVITVATANDFVDVSTVAYEQTGLSPTVGRKVLSQPTRWLAPQWHVRVIYEHDQPVACAMLLFSHGIAGVYWVGTIPTARGRGYADAIMRDVSNHAFDHGARAVVLQASAMGEPIYARMGYREITTYPWFLVLAKPA